MEENKKITPQKKYYEKNKDKIIESYSERYKDDIEYRNYVNEKRRESYQKYKTEYNKNDVKRQVLRYQNDPEYRAKKLEYGRKYRELKKLECVS
jgi:hypothetical protein